MDLQIINANCLQANTPLGEEVLKSVWYECNKSPWDDNQVTFHADDYIAASAAFAKFGVNIQFPLFK